MKRSVKRASLAAGLAMSLLGGVGTPGALAYGNTSWYTICAGYAGTSWYNSGTNVSWSTTGADDSDEVAAAVRYYLGSTTYTHGFGWAVRTRAQPAYGGLHQSYCFPGTQTKTT